MAPLSSVPWMEQSSATKLNSKTQHKTTQFAHMRTCFF